MFWFKGYKSHTVIRSQTRVHHQGSNGNQRVNQCYPYPKWWFQVEDMDKFQENDDPNDVDYGCNRTKSQT